MATSTTTITSPYLATFTSPPDNIRFQGFYSTDFSVQSKICGNTFDSFKVYSTYAFCCPTPDNIRCRSATTCSGNTRIDISGDRYPCRSEDRCGPIEYYEFYPDSTKGWSATAWGCLDDFQPSTVYQNMQIPLITTITSEITGSPADQTPGISDPATTPTPSPTSATEGDSSSSDTNVGAIAGGVVGGVAGLALILGVAFILLKRRRKRKDAVAEIGEMVEQ